MDGRIDDSVSFNLLRIIITQKYIKYCNLKKQFICFENPALLNCGCKPKEVAANNIRNVVEGRALAVCELESTSEGGKGAIWSLICDRNNNGRQDEDEFTLPRLEMAGSDCTLNAQLSCNTQIPPFMVVHLF